MRVDTTNPTVEKENSRETAMLKNQKNDAKNMVKALEEKEGPKTTFNEEDPNDRKKLAEALDKINNTVRVFNKQIHFTEYEKTGELWVHIIDAESKKVVKQIPPEELLEIKARIEEMVGLLIDEKR